MGRHPTLPDVGRIVEITRGRDRGTYGVVLGQEAGRFVLVADGDKRKVDSPKKKNTLHVRSTPELAREVLETLRNEGKVTNARLRYVLRQYQQVHRTTGGGNVEGGIPDGER